MRKILILIIGLLLVAVNINNVLAEGPVSNDYCATVYTSDGEHKSFIDIHDAWDYADDNLGSKIVLLHNVFTDGNQLEVGTSPFGYSEFTLDLNGFTIDGEGERIIYINSGVFSSYLNLDILTIIDSSTSKTGKLINGGGEYGGAIYVEGILNFNGGTIENCYNGSSLSCGGGIYAAPLQRDGQAHIIDVHPAGIINIDGGHINNCGNNGSGGGLYVGKSGEAHLINGSITNCYTSAKGGGVAVMNGATLTMENGFLIDNCKADLGGGINCYSWSTLNMNGGTVSNSYAEEWGGGINLEGSGYQLEGRPLSPAKAYFYGGKIVNNKAGEKGGGVATHLEALSDPAQIFMKNEVYIKDNTVNDIPNNLYLDSDGTDFEDSAYIRMENTDQLRGYVGITCDEFRQITTKDLYPSNVSVLCADTNAFSVMYNPGTQLYYTTQYHEAPHLDSIKMANEAYTDVSVDYNSHQVYIYIDRMFDDVETVIINWSGESITENDGTDWRTSTNKPYNLKFFNCFGIEQRDQDILIENTINMSEYWNIHLIEVQDELLVCNGEELTHKVDSKDESLNYKYYLVHPGETIHVVAEEPQEGYAFDRWQVNRRSNVVLDDDVAHSPDITMTMPETDGRRFGLKASYRLTDELSDVNEPFIDLEDGTNRIKVSYSKQNETDENEERSYIDESDIGYKIPNTGIDY